MGDEGNLIWFSCIVYFRLFVSEALQGFGCARKFHQFPRKTWDRVGAMHQDKTGRSAFAFRTMAPLIYPYGIRIKEKSKVSLRKTQNSNKPVFENSMHMGGKQFERKRIFPSDQSLNSLRSC